MHIGSLIIALFRPPIPLFIYVLFIYLSFT